jgi:hypothetical protein
MASGFYRVLMLAQFRNLLERSSKAEDIRYEKFVRKTAL